MLLFLLSTFFGCNYHSAIQTQEIQSVGIAFIKNDLLGNLRSYLVLELEKSSLFRFSKQPELLVYVECVEKEDEDIGFQYARSVTTRSDRLVVNEKRKWVEAVVSIKNTKTDKTVLKPTKIMAAIDFDFDPAESDDKFTAIGPNRVPMVTFSLGELESEQGARPIAQELLMQNLAKRIVDYISCEKIYRTDVTQ